LDPIHIDGRLRRLFASIQGLIPLWPTWHIFCYCNIPSVSMFCTFSPNGTHMNRSDSPFSKRRIVFGCGNPFFGDDGFGAGVIEHLTSHFELPDDVACLDIGTAIRDPLFDMLLSSERPDQIIIVDAMDLQTGAPGRIYETKICDFSLHQFPTTNMLKEIQEETDIDVRILVVQPEPLPEEVRPGLSEPVQAAVPEMCRRIMKILQADHP
jgi:coenzyme F420 hydrogenase subunit delta